MSGLSDHDPAPDHRGRRPMALIVMIVIVIIAVVLLHLTGVIGPGSH
jgi:hypothetical protein